jgi:hypothetical protein
LLAQLDETDHIPRGERFSGEIVALSALVSHVVMPPRDIGSDHPLPNLDEFIQAIRPIFRVIAEVRVIGAGKKLAFPSTRKDAILDLKGLIREI